MPSSSDALELGYADDGARATCAASTRAGQARGRVIYGIGTDLCDIRRIEATLARRGERFAEKVLGPRRDRRLAPALGARRRARHALPGDALRRQGGLLQGDRPGHPLADDLARLRGRSTRAGGQPVIVLHGELADWFDGARLVGARQPSPTRPTMPPLRGRRVAAARLIASPRRTATDAMTEDAPPPSPTRPPCAGRARRRRPGARRRRPPPPGPSARRRADPVRPQLAGPPRSSSSCAPRSRACAPTC